MLLAEPEPAPRDTQVPCISQRSSGAGFLACVVAAPRSEWISRGLFSHSWGRACVHGLWMWMWMWTGECLMGDEGGRDMRLQTVAGYDFVGMSRGRRGEEGSRGRGCGGRRLCRGRSTYLRGLGFVYSGCWRGCCVVGGRGSRQLGGRLRCRLRGGRRGPTCPVGGAGGAFLL